MPRKRKVTRSLKSLECECLCLDIRSGETYTEKVNITGELKNPVEALIRAKEMTDTEDVVICKILNSKEVVKRYWMEEDEFLKFAHVFEENNREREETEEVEGEEE